LQGIRVLYVRKTCWGVNYWGGVDNRVEGRFIKKNVVIIGLFERGDDKNKLTAKKIA